MTEYRPRLGAVLTGGEVTFRVWAPRPKEVVLRLVHDGVARDVPMPRDGDGFCEATLPASAGDRYGYLLDGEGPYPDPCSRSQPEGVHGLSEVLEPGAFSWSDTAWTPPPYSELVMYECHAGTFTADGTFDAAIERLPYLAELGINALELMPVAAFGGRWNWGYDGVALFAPSERYGGPNGLRRLVDAAHCQGIAVILDIVYNHFGPDGNYTGLFGDYLDNSVDTPWGAAIAFGRTPVRQFYRENLLHWIHEYHVDGFRFDATHALVDPSDAHILAELSELAESEPGPRPYLIAESHENDVRYMRAADRGGFGFDGVWTDDFHHAVRVLLERDREGYFANYSGTPADLAATIEQGFFYEGQPQPTDGQPRGTPAREVPWGAFVYCIQNHDQVGNRAFGERITATASHADIRAATLLLLLLPQVPMLFQGQEFFATSPFQYFTDHEPGLGELVTEGRRREFAGFSAFGDPELREAIPDPQAAGTFERSKLRWDEVGAGIGRLAYGLHKALIALRHEDPVLRAYRAERLPIHSEVHGRALVLHFEAEGRKRWLVANFGEEVRLDLEGCESAAVLLHTDESRFGGAGWAVSPGAHLEVPPHTAVFLARDR